MKGNKTIVVLTGGLGNQLFTLAAGLYFSNGEEVCTDSHLLSPRKNNSQQAEVYSLGLPSRVQVIELFQSKGTISKRVAGYLLRIGLKRKGLESIPGYSIAVKIIGGLVLSLTAKKFVFPLVGKGVGYFNSSKVNPRNFLIGYFQSYRWASNPFVYEELMKISPINRSLDLESLRMLSQNEKPLIVHIRLGDYKFENHFGIPSRNYFNAAIDELWANNIYQKIWVFSDEIEEAKSFINESFHSRIRWIHEVNASTVETFEAMRYGHGYVIANSTFSWWAAFLSYTGSPRVIAPWPWFAGMESPIELIPPTWETREAF